MSFESIHKLFANQRNFSFAVLILFLVFLSLRLYHINAPVLDRHSWNQVSAAATAMNIYKDPKTFFAPESNAFQTDRGSAVLAQEFPVYPGTVALLYGIFGPHIWVARMLGILIAALGWLYLLKLCLKQESKTTSLIILSIYSFNSHNWFYDRAINSDTGMVSMMLVAFYYFTNYLEKRSWNCWLLLTLSTTLAGLFKPYGLMIGVSFLFLLYRRQQWFMLKRIDLWLMGIIAWGANLAWLYHTQVNLDSAITLGSSKGLGFDWHLFLTWDYYNILQQRFFDQILTPFMGVFFLYGLFSNRVRSDIGASLFAGNLFYLILITNGNYVHNYYQLPLTPALSIYAGLGLTQWSKTPSPKLSSRFRQRLVVVFFALFIIWSGKRAWNSFRLSMGPKIVGDYIQKMNVEKGTRMLAIEGSGTRYHEMLYYAGLQGWVLRYPRPDRLKQLKKLGVKLVAVHLEEPQFTNEGFMKPLKDQLTPVWTSYKCKNSYGDPCFIGVYRFKETF